jgi:hypothetical protein
LGSCFGINPAAPRSDAISFTNLSLANQNVFNILVALYTLVAEFNLHIIYNYYAVLFLWIIVWLASGDGIGLLYLEYGGRNDYLRATSTWLCCLSQ